MSSPIWTRCAGSSRIRALAARPVRLVEAQHLVSTRRLVDSAEEQALLESVLEKSKPTLPADPEFAGLHFLLTTSFRYPPLRHGSRFATRVEFDDRLTTMRAPGFPLSDRYELDSASGEWRVVDTP